MNVCRTILFLVMKALKTIYSLQGRIYFMLQMSTLLLRVPY